ncbi:PREDICTED: fibulin-1-like isoform X1 [Branchiostoma belcheri]|uniref:Fibulin-1 n=1 Tax=Branchiostoma belcheri TaxID=7741 RepID=A0A6P4ZTG7_BRABE|nr:PREDICTED: fibulin-1-like isoform X1 [Branchiostoma belcheri]
MKRFTDCVLLVATLCLLGRCSGQFLASMSECCMRGSELAKQNPDQDCANFPVGLLNVRTEDRENCRITARVCCHRERRSQQCYDGIMHGRSGGVCKTRFSFDECGGKEYKKCCECCQLGLVAHRQLLRCDISSIKALNLGSYCAEAYKDCCLNGKIVATTRPPTVTSAPLSGSSGSGMCERFSGRLCEHICINTAEGHVCRCREGFRLQADDKTCIAVTSATSGSQCENSPCEQRCVPTGTGVQCSCEVGYQLNRDRVSCDDVNECAHNTDDCQEGQECFNTMGSFTCRRLLGCGTGYEMNPAGECVDMDECELGVDECEAGFKCTNQPGSFRCVPRVQCGVGYNYDRTGNCVDINECDGSSCPRGTKCINTVGSYRCQRLVTCGPGYELNEDESNCEDIDECARGTHDCQGLSECKNNRGSYICQCPSGYTADQSTRTCQDIDECIRFGGRVCAQNCINTEGSYTCECREGFELAADSRNCRDLNECDNNPCEQRCINVYGSFQCSCNRGYRVASDGRTCEDVDECALYSGQGQGSLCMHECVNIRGSYTCRCPPGYELLQDDRSCADIKECDTGAHNCTEQQECFNIRGGYRCHDVTCPDNYVKTTPTGSSSDEQRCVKGPCKVLDIDCIMERTTAISYNYLDLPSDLVTPVDLISMKAQVYGYIPRLRFRITEGNQGGWFNVTKRGLADGGALTGTVMLVRPLMGPFTTTLRLDMDRLNNANLVVGRSIAYITVYVSKYKF